MDTGVLDTPLYAIREAARFLSVHSGTLRRWLEGARVSGVNYPPVIRETSTGSDEVTWAEFVEAGFLREYRSRQVSLQYMRPLIDAMRTEFQVRYPLAHFKPLVDTASRELVPQIEDRLQVPDGLRLMRRIGQSWQLQWAPAVLAFLDKVDFDTAGVAERMHPL